MTWMSRFPGQPSPEEPSRAVATEALGVEAGRWLLALARRAVCAAAHREPHPRVGSEELWPAVQAVRASFVTLTHAGELRGCIGHLTASLPLYRDVIDNATSASLRDARFSPVTPEEVDELRIEISVLSPCRALTYHSTEELLPLLRVGEDGVVLKYEGRQATFLPQVWQQLPEKETFLNHLAEKGGFPRGIWRSAEASLWVYSVEHWCEAEDGATKAQGSGA